MICHIKFLVELQNKQKEMVECKFSEFHKKKKIIYGNCRFVSLLSAIGVWNV